MGALRDRFKSSLQMGNKKKHHSILCSAYWGLCITIGPRSAAVNLPLTKFSQGRQSLLPERSQLPSDNGNTYMYHITCFAEDDGRVTSVYQLVFSSYEGTLKCQFLFKTVRAAPKAKQRGKKSRYGNSWLHLDQLKTSTQTCCGHGFK